MERDTMDHVGLVSILTPCFNSAATLPRYMAGISAQTCRNFEVVFVNDGSTDNTEHVFFELALGDREARMTLSVFSHPNLNSLLPLSEADCNPFRGEVVLGMEEVQLATLDTFCCNRNIERIHLLKVDTQGFDLHVLEGSADLLEKRRVAFLLVEVNFATIYSGQATPGSLVDFLCSRGYFPFQFYNVRRVPYVPGQGAKSRAWFAQKRLPYPNTGRFPIAWCDVLFAPYVSCDV